MTDFTRRSLFQTGAAALAAQVPLKASTKGGIQIAHVMAPGQPDSWKVWKQIGVDHAIATVLGLLSRTERSAYAETLARMKAEFNAAGIEVAGVESHPVPAEKIKLGAPGRDEEIENYIAAIQALKQVGIPMICYNWMAGLGWYRTNTKVLERGGALTSEFDITAAEAEGLTQWGRISEEKIWDNLVYFQKAVIPVAEKVGMQMALHPDDPPLSPLRGIGRILTSAANFEKVMEIVPSPINGVTFCQANFLAMGENIYELAEKWCKRKKVFFVHYRDIQGNARRMRETFHDNGPTDMARLMRIYHESGFVGPMRPDHAPVLAGEANDRPGYMVQGNIFAIGYMRGILDMIAASGA
jgi:mannonate dehydratase